MKTKIICVLITLFVSVTTVAAQDASKAILYSAATVYTMQGEALSPGEVLVVDGKIKAVAGSIPEATRGNAETVNLGENSVLMPGLVDAYTQSGLGEDGSDEFSKETTPDFRTIYSMDWKSDDFNHRLAEGTTTMCVCPGTQNVISGIASIVKTAGETVLNDDYALVASLCSDPTSRNNSRQRPDSIYVRQPTNRMGVVWMLRTAFNKVTKNQPELKTVDQALTGKRPFFVVARASYDLNTVATLADEFKFSPIIVGGHEAYKVKDLIAERKYPVILNGSTTGSIDGPEQTELCWNLAGVLDQAGIPFAISGDNQLEQARFACRFGLAPDKALRAITTAPAKMLGIDNRVGSIEAGKDADLIALDGNPLEFTTAIEWVMIDGKIMNVQNANRKTKGN